MIHLEQVFDGKSEEAWDEKNPHPWEFRSKLASNYYFFEWKRLAKKYYNIIFEKRFLDYNYLFIYLFKLGFFFR